MVAGFLLGAISVFMIFVMFEIMNKDNLESDTSDKWCQIFGMSLIWLLAIGLIVVFTSPSETVTAISYSGAGIK